MPCFCNLTITPKAISTSAKDSSTAVIFPMTPPLVTTSSPFFQAFNSVL
jgi:hypothetical protein